MKRIASVVLGLVLTTSTGVAQEPTERRLPQWIRCHEDYACFTLEQTQELLVLEQRLLQAEASYTLEHGLTLHLEELNTNLTTQSTELQAALDLRALRIQELTEQLFSEIAQKNEWRAKAETPTVWPLVVGGVLALLAVGLAAGVLVAGIPD